MSDLVGYRVGRLESSRLVGDVAFNNAYNLLGVYFDVRRADAVVYVRDGYRLPHGRVEWFVHVVQVHRLGAVERVELQYHVLG